MINVDEALRIEELVQQGRIKEAQAFSRRAWRRAKWREMGEDIRYWSGYVAIAAIPILATVAAILILS